MPSVRPARRSLAAELTAAVLGIAFATSSGCVQSKIDPGCVNLGGGWHACSAEMMTSNEGTGAAASGGASAVAVTPSATAGSGGVHSMAAGNAGIVAAGDGRASASAGVDAVAGTHAPLAGTVAGMNTAGGMMAVAMLGARGAAAGAASDAGGSGFMAAGSAVAGMGVGASGAAYQAGGGGAGNAAVDTAGSAAVGGEPVCCHGLGQCLASTAIVAERRALLARDTCPDADVCQPSAWLDRAFLARSCVSVLQAEGRCLPDCLASLAPQTERLPRDVCADHELCAPCFDPVTGAATGACALGVDLGPRRLPRTFATCCGALGSARGLCVPRSYVPNGVSMPQQDCADATLACVPSEWVRDPTSKPVQCTDELRGSGICVPECVATAIGGLITLQANCNTGDQCYPCQLIGGQATGLCTAEL